MKKYITIGVLTIVAISILSYVLGWVGEAATVAKEEFGPKAMLVKYEWFKDASAQVDQKVANIKVYKEQLTDLKEQYEGTARKDWDRTDKEQYSQWKSEIAGVIASYNSLCAEYNSQMAKFNWRFANKGQLPEGATEVLPRKYKPYSTQ